MNIILQGVINQLSYGQVCWNYLKELVKDNRVYLFPIIDGSITPLPNQLDIVKKCSNIADIKRDDITLKIWHQHELFTRVGKGKYFAMPIFELDGFNSIEQASLQFPDELIVNSKWAASIIEKIGRKAEVVPLGFDEKIFFPVEPPKRSSFAFLNIGKAEKRKGHDFLINCFNKAFNKEDDVELWLAWTNPFPNCKMENWRNLIRTSKLASKIKEVPFLKTQQELAYLINCSNCGIYPSLSEGFCLPAIETIACGKPLICTNYSGFTEYVNKDNSYLINIDRLQPAKDEEWPQFNGQFNWAKMDADQEDQLITYMRSVHQNRPNNLHSVESIKKFTWTQVTKQLLEKLKR